MFKEMQREIFLPLFPVMHSSSIETCLGENCLEGQTLKIRVMNEEKLTCSF